MFKELLRRFGYTRIQDPKASKYDADSELFKYIERLPTDYFYQVEPDMLEYLENLAYKSLNERKESHYRLREDCRKTLSLLLAGIGGFFGIAVTQLTKENINSLAVIAVIATCAWLFFCSIYLLKSGIQAIKQPPVHPDPDIFYDSWVKYNDISLEESRKRFLPSLQYDIQKMIAINYRVAERLNRVRFFATWISIPLVLFILALVA